MVLYFGYSECFLNKPNRGQANVATAWHKQDSPAITQIVILILISWDSDIMEGKNVFFQYKSCAVHSLKKIKYKRARGAVYLMMTHIYKEEKINCLRDKYDIYFYFSGRDKQRSEFRFYSICRLHEKRKTLSCHVMRFS
ncbi:MAG: hypothetical protein ACMZI0_14825 [Symbiopectobacterium sp.]|uniref:hypothetical protein n=1 Tax=Symbiopectobacterium sp. TaxID=2952789 RepID=UPI0039ECB6A5